MSVLELGGALALGGGGIAVRLSGHRELIARWCSWSLYAPALWVGMTFAPLALALVIGAICLWELGRMWQMPLQHRIFSYAALTAVAWPGTRVVEALAGGLVLLVVTDREPALAFDRVARLALGTALVGAAGAAMVVLPPLSVLAVASAVSLGDVGAWCSGRLLEGPRLSPLSPGKTWSGAVGGAAVAAATVAVLAGPQWPLIVAAAVGGPLGDLLESAAKRGAGAKDTGSWLPGFGGLCDRVDSLLLALPLALVLLG